MDEQIKYNNEPMSRLPKKIRTTLQLSLILFMVISPLITSLLLIFLINEPVWFSIIFSTIGALLLTLLLVYMFFSTWITPKWISFYLDSFIVGKKKRKPFEFKYTDVIKIQTAIAQMDAEGNQCDFNIITVGSSKSFPYIVVLMRENSLKLQDKLDSLGITYKKGREL